MRLTRRRSASGVLERMFPWAAARMPRQTEPSANNALGGLLRSMLPGSQVLSEHTRVIQGRPGLQPDLLITDPHRALLDRRVICDLLGFDEATYVAVRRLAAKWCAEPSVHGAKPRPRGAKLII